MRFPPAAVLFAALYVLFPISQAEALQACLNQEDSLPNKDERQHSEIAAISDFCKNLAKREDVADEIATEESHKTVETTVLIILLRAYAEALGEMR